MNNQQRMIERLKYYARDNETLVTEIPIKDLLEAIAEIQRQDKQIETLFKAIDKAYEDK